MELFYGCIPILNELHCLTSKPQLMISRQTLNRLIIFSFMVLVGYWLAKAIYHKSIMGIILALVSLGAGIYFLYILAKAKEQLEMETENINQTT
jgi:hypothetical protein